jgi:hypothetical protein
MRHVFVETNWVVDYAAPAHMRSSAAAELLEQASEGKLKLLLPSIYISEARSPIFKKFQVKDTADRVRKFLRWAREHDVVSPDDDKVTRTVIDQMEQAVRNDLNKLDDTLSGLNKKIGLEIFDLSQEMLERCTRLSFDNLGLESFDQAILAAILVRAEQLVKLGETDLTFCERDGDLQPWNKNGEPIPELAKLYDAVGVWVYGDFLLQTPPMPQDWPYLKS